MSKPRITKLAEFAPGLPVKGKITPLPKVKEPQVWEFSAHPHEAARAGLHLDLRLGNPSTGIAHSFVIPKKIPEPGTFSRVIPTSDHTLDYMNFTGDISSGYGKGIVLPGRRTQAEVYHADPSDAPGTKLRFNLYEDARPEEFAIRKDKQGKWFLHNKTQTRERRQDLPAAKPKYKEIDVDKVDASNTQQAMMPKLDGAHGLIDLKAGRAPRVFSYRVGKKTGTGLIEHTHKLPELLKMKVPKELDGTILRGEIVGMKKTASDVVPAEQIAGMLNSKVWASRQKQQEAGVQLKAFPFSVVKYKGRDMENAPFEEKLKVLHKVQKALPELQPPPMAVTPKDKIDLLNAVRSKTHPLTEEGVVLVDRNKPGVPIKAKLAPDFDVYTRAVKPAVSGSGKQLDRAGAIAYSWTPNGPIIGQLGGFKHDEARDMLANPNQYVGRVAKVKAMRRFGTDEKPGALFQPRFKEWHLDKGDIEKSAIMAGFVDEITKISDARDLSDKALSWVREHPYITAAGAAGLGAGSVIAKRLLTRAPQHGGEVAQRLREIARREGLSVAKEIKPPPVLDPNAAPVKKTLLQRLRAATLDRPLAGYEGRYRPTVGEYISGRLENLGVSPSFRSGSGVAVVPKGQKKIKGVSVGFGYDDPVTAELTMGGAGRGTRRMRKVQDAMDRAAAEGKVFEQSALGIQSSFPRGTSIADIATKYNIKLKGNTLRGQINYLNQLQNAAKKEFGQGFVVKPYDISRTSGHFATQEGNWGNLYKNYLKDIHPQMSKLEEGELTRELTQKLRTNPSFKGTGLQSALQHPEKTLVQQMENLVRTKKGVPVEYRVQSIGGEVPSELAYHRYGANENILERIPGLKHLMRSKERGSREGAAEWVRREVVPKLKGNYRKGTYGFDVARVKNPDGTYGFKLMEANPAGSYSMSEFLDPKVNPMVGQDVSKWLTGRDAPVITGLKSLGAGSVAGAGGLAAASAIPEQKRRPTVLKAKPPSSL